MRVLFGLAAVALLTVAGCGKPMVPSFAAKLRDSAPQTEKRKAPLSRISLAGGDVVVAGPEGYCLDPATSRSGQGQGFALVASCMILSGGQTGTNVPPVLVAVTVGPRAATADVPTAQVLADAAEAPLQASSRDDGMVLAHLGRGGAAVLPNGDRRYWRGAFIEGDRMVGLALYAPKGHPLAGAAGAGFLTQMRDSIHKASSGGTRPALAAVATPDQAAPTKPRSTRSKPALSRLFARVGLP
ncbi:dihydroxy-acid dehydratase [Sagittula sp. SSi028]|uniref:dihydroxy-acid dehydratase n=1 Tax=Sagittula sp. SSi028 TaxID=3400636 RepID=UPI003AF81038